MFIQGLCIRDPIALQPRSECFGSEIRLFCIRDPIVLDPISDCFASEIRLFRIWDPIVLIRDPIVLDPRSDCFGSKIRLLSWVLSKKRDPVPVFPERLDPDPNDNLTQRWEFIKENKKVKKKERKHALDQETIKKKSF